MDDCHLNNIPKKFFFLFNQIGKNKNLWFLKKWTYILCNKNNIVEDLMNAFLNSHWIESNL